VCHRALCRPELKKAPPTEGDLTIAQAQVTNAEASYLNAQNNYANTVITAPFDAVVGAVGVKVGDQANSSTAAFTLITANQMVDLSFNEVDATKLKQGQKATLTFDAIPDLVLAGTVAELSPLGTVTQGVVSYNVKISLDTGDDRVRPGMSVNANIITNVRENVLSLPSEAVKSQGTQSYVEVPSGAFTSASSTPVVTLPTLPSRASVTVGISNDSSTEIVTGLSEGDWVVIKTTTTGTKKTTAATQQSGFSALGGGATRGLGR
jgi:HlyD family secretion protein